MEEIKQEIMFESITQVVPCPLQGYGYLTISQCQECKHHREIQNLMEKGPATGRRVDQVVCSYPAKRPVEFIIDLNGATMAEGVRCPVYKSILYISECMECELHRGLDLVTRPLGLKARLFWWLSDRKDSTSVLCGKHVGRQCNYVITGAREV